MRQKQRSAHKQKTEREKDETWKKNLAQHTSLRSSRLDEAEREMVINLLDIHSGLSLAKWFFFLSTPIMQFLMHLTLWLQHSIMITRGSIKREMKFHFLRRGIVSHPLSAHKSFKDVRRKSRKINKQKSAQRKNERCSSRKQEEKTFFSLCCLFWYGNKVKLTNLLLRAKCKKQKRWRNWMKAMKIPKEWEFWTL